MKATVLNHRHEKTRWSIQHTFLLHTVELSRRSCEAIDNTHSTPGCPCSYYSSEFGLPDVRCARHDPNLHWFLFRLIVLFYVPFLSCRHILCFLRLLGWAFGLRAPKTPFLDSFPVLLAMTCSEFSPLICSLRCFWIALCVGICILGLVIVYPKHRSRTRWTCIFLSMAKKSGYNISRHLGLFVFVLAEKSFARWSCLYLTNSFC